MNQLQNYALGAWISGTDKGKDLYNSVTGEVIANASSTGLDFAKMMDYGRTKGGPALRKLTFHERGRMLKTLALHLHSKKEDFYPLSYATGATRVDSWIDIEGGIGNLFAYASLRKQFPNEKFYVDGEHAPLSKGGSFIGHHIMVPKEGVAIHINAFNFPIWGMLEKIAVNLLAGVPAIVKPATVTCFLTEFMVREIINSKILPEGALQLICGSANGILDHVESQDIVTFTGSASTGQMLKSHPRLIQESVPFNMEADRAIKYVKDSLENLIQYISKTRYDEMAISQEYHKLTKQLDKHHIYTLDYKGTKMVFLNTKKGLKIFSFNNLNNLIRFIHRDRFVPKLAEKPDNVLLQQSAETFAKEIATTLFGKNINDYYSLLGDTIWSLNNEGYALRKPEAHEYAPIIKEAFKSDHFSYDKYIEDYSLKVYPANEFYASGKLPNYLKTNENDWLFFGYKPKHHTRPSFEVSQEAFYYLMTRVDGRWQISGMIE